MKYFVSFNSGSDSNAGNNVAAPFKTTAPVNALISGGKLKAGDIIQFKSGEKHPGAYLTGFASSWQSKGSIEISSYGTGSQPLFDMYKYVAGGWTLYDGTNNIWRVDLTNTANYTGNTTNTKQNGANVGNLRINNLFLGRKYSNMAALISSITQWDFCCTPADYTDAISNLKYLYVKSFGNPGSIYTTTEIAVSVNGTPCLTILGNVDYYDLDILGHGGACAEFGYSQKVNFNNLTIREFGGSTLVNNVANPTVRYGTGIQAYGDAIDCSVVGCYFEEGFEAPMTLQGTNASFENIIFKNNRVNKCPQAFEVWSEGTGGKWKNVKFQNNICDNIGYDQRHYQHENVMTGKVKYFDQFLGVHILMYNNGVNMRDLEISNNVFNRAKDGMYCWYLTNQTDISLLPNSHDNDIFLLPGTRLNSNLYMGADQLVENYVGFSSAFSLEKNSRWFIIPNAVTDLGKFNENTASVQGRLTASNYAADAGIRQSLSWAKRTTNLFNQGIPMLRNNETLSGDMPFVDLLNVVNGCNGATSVMMAYRATGTASITGEPFLNFNGQLYYTGDTSVGVQFATNSNNQYYYRVYWFGTWRAWVSVLTSVSAIDPVNITQTTTLRLVSDVEKTTWNGSVGASANQIAKRTASGSLPNPSIDIASLINKFDDAFLPNVSYYGDGSTSLTGEPITNFNGALMFIGKGTSLTSGSGYQEAVKSDGSIIYRRMLWGGVWKTWYRVMASLFGNIATTATAQTDFTVTFATFNNTNYFVEISPRNLLSTERWYISAKTTTSFTVKFNSPLTGSVNFDWKVNS